jgi:A/G-specific adenine glycosylase
MTIARFKKIIWDYYRKNHRDLPWRMTRDPYAIMVSELMLQQTQVDRVIPKYLSFLRRFPTPKKLARAPLSHVLSEWQGLGYNRRALYLKKTFETVEKDFAGDIATALRSDIKLPGIGPYTRGAIRTFAWNEPHAFIETNIRSVYIHHFFPNKKKVHDKDILSYIEKTIDAKNPREWYWALMDYGAHLKRTVKNPSRKSKHHTKQSRFAGSNRELRSYILKALLERPETIESLHKKLDRHILDIDRNLRAMTREGLIRITKGKICICN